MSSQDIFSWALFLPPIDMLEWQSSRQSVLLSAEDAGQNGGCLFQECCGPSLGYDRWLTLSITVNRGTMIHQENSGTIYFLIYLLWLF